MKHLTCAIGALIGRRVVVALAAASCVAACLMPTGTAAASATLLPRPVAAARLDAVGQAMTERTGSAAQPGPGRLGGSAVFSGRPGSPGRSIVLSGSPGAPVANPRTDTVYVPIQCTTSFCSPNTPGHVVDVISTAKCNLKVRSDCRVVARARVGSGPLAAAIDLKTDTIYVTNGNDGTVSVLDGARCNAIVTSGCGRALATIKVGKFPVAAAVNPKTRTVYVANAGGGSVSVIDVASCNAVTTRGCRHWVRTVRDSAGPDAIDVDVATDTVYAANAGSGNGDTVSVIDGAACNGRHGGGCGRTPPAVTVGSNPFWVAADQASDTVYVASFVNGFNDGSVSVINGARCNARITSGCAAVPPAVPTGTGTSFVAVDQARHTVFALNQHDDTLSAINTRTCDGTVTSSCGKRPPNQKAAPDRGPRYNGFPNAFALIPRTGTAYLMNEGGASILSVTSIRRCNATDTAGCRREAPSVPEHESLMSVDPATGTIYAGNQNLPDIDVLDGATCHASHLSGCTPVAKIPMGHPEANVGAIDHATHTLYAADPSSDTVSVINTATCNATDTAGCAATPPTIKVGHDPGAPVLDKVTKTLYVPYGSNANRVAVVDAGTCNAGDTSGCGRAAGVVKVGKGTFVLAVSARTDTVYAPHPGFSFSGDTVSVINGATCDGTNHSGCGHLAATVKVGIAPYGVAVDDGTNTVYVADNTDGDTPGMVSVINGATCNGSDTSGCERRFPTMAGRSPLLVAMDTRTDILYVTDFSSAAVSVLNGSRCNAEVTSGCGAAGREQAVGSGPQGIAVNQHANTVYVANIYQPGSLSIFRGAR